MYFIHCSIALAVNTVRVLRYSKKILIQIINRILKSMGYALLKTSEGNSTTEIYILCSRMR
jgi:hypothetical protein